MDVSVVVPAHNEAGNLERLVEAVREALSEPSFGHEYELLLVDDNSTDDTPGICDRLAAENDAVEVVHHRGEGGFGNALKAGLEAATGDVLVPFMGDLSDDPADIPDMVAAIEDGYDVAYGSRFVEGGSVTGYPGLKLFYNRAFNNLIRLLFGIRARDVTNAFTAYRAEVVDSVGVDNLVAESFDLTAELPLRAHIQGFRSTEVPVTWRSRDHGVSKLNATRKGPLYVRRLVQMFFLGNVAAATDLWDAMTTGSSLRTGGALAFALLFLVSLFSLSGYGEVFAVLAGADVLWLVPALGTYLGSFLFRTWRYRVLLRTAGHLATRGGVFRCIMAGWFVNFLVPARPGDLVRGLTLKTTEEVPFGVATGMVAIERVLDLLVLVGAGLLVTRVLLPGLDALPLVAGLAIAGGILLGLGVLYGLQAPLGRMLDGRAPAARRGLEALVVSLETTAANPAAVALAALLSVPVWSLEAGTLLFSARALGLHLGVVVTAGTAIVAFVSQTVPSTPAGIGTYETTITNQLAAAGVAPETGMAIALLDHFARVALVYALGAISIVHIGFRSRAYFRDAPGNDETGTEATRGETR